MGPLVVEKGEREKEKCTGDFMRTYSKPVARKMRWDDFQEFLQPVRLKD